MKFEFEPDPKAIEQQSFKQIRELTDLTAFSQVQQQVVMQQVMRKQNLMLS